MREHTLPLPNSPTPTPSDLEDLIFDVRDCIKRYDAGRLEAITAAIDGGRLLTHAKALTRHGGWLDWLTKTGLAQRTAADWMRLSELGLEPADVLEQGGLRAVLKAARSRPRQKTTAQRLAEAEARIGTLKADYYAALSERQRLLRELRRDGAN